MLVVVAVAAIALAAGWDALRGGDDPAAQPEEQATSSTREDDEGTNYVPLAEPDPVSGALYYTDEGCELRAATLPDIRPTDAPNWDECRFTLSPDTSRVGDETTAWDPAQRPAAGPPLPGRRRHHPGRDERRPRGGAHRGHGTRVAAGRDPDVLRERRDPRLARGAYRGPREPAADGRDRASERPGQCRAPAEPACGGAPLARPGQAGRPTPRGGQHRGAVARPGRGLRRRPAIRLDRLPRRSPRPLEQPFRDVLRRVDRHARALRLQREFTSAAGARGHQGRRLVARRGPDGGRHRRQRLRFHARPGGRGGALRARRQRPRLARPRVAGRALPGRRRTGLARPHRSLRPPRGFPPGGGRLQPARAPDPRPDLGRAACGRSRPLPLHARPRATRSLAENRPSAAAAEIASPSVGIRPLDVLEEGERPRRLSGCLRARLDARRNA